MCSSTTGPHWRCLRLPSARSPLGDVLVCLSGQCHLWVTGGVSASRHGWSGRGSGVVGCVLSLEGATVDCPKRRRSSCAVWLSVTDLLMFPRYYTMSRVAARFVTTALFCSDACRFCHQREGDKSNSLCTFLT